MRRYIFADESGNFDFSLKPDASRFFAVGTVAIDGDSLRETVNTELSRLKYAMANNGVGVEGAFHATTDLQAVRDQVFDTIRDLGLVLESTALDKRKAQPHLRSTDENFYQYAWWFHFNKLIWDLGDTTELVVVGASLGTKKRMALFRRAISDVVDQRCPTSVSRRVVSWRDESDHCLQVADYMLWAVTRDLERGDKRSRNIITDQIGSVFQPFYSGTKTYY